MQIFIESIYIKFLPTLLEKIHTSPPSPSLDYFQVQLFPSPYIFLLLCLFFAEWKTLKRYILWQKQKEIKVNTLNSGKSHILVN